MQWDGLSSDELANEINAFLAELQNESDRGCALVGIAVLDEMLKNILESFFADIAITKEIFNGINAPLSSLSARNKVAYSLGLISEFEYSSLKLLTKIRNLFAHRSHGLTFDTQEIADVCAKIKFRYKFEGMEEAETHKFILSTWGQKPRGLFTFSVYDMFTRLIFRPKKVVKEKRKVQNWAD